MTLLPHCNTILSNVNFLIYLNVARKFDLRHISISKVQSWWRGISTRNKLMCLRLSSIPGNLLNRLVVQFSGGVGWKHLDLGTSTIDVKEGMDESILSINFPTLFIKSPLVSINIKMQDQEKKMIRKTIELEKNRMTWGDSVRSWKTVVLSLLKKGDLEMKVELDILERMMAMERGRGRIHECIAYHDRSIRVCINMSRNGDYKCKSFF